MRILGTGGALPDNEVPNGAFSGIVDTSDEWIVSRTGIRSRRIASGDTALSLASAAAERAIAAAGIPRERISVVICACVTGETLTPSLACLLQRDLALRENDILAFDINAACTGFIYALSLARRLPLPGEYALVVGCEALSRVTDFTDRATCVLFGDGAGAVILEASDGEFHFVSGARGDDKALVIGSIPAAPNPFAETRAAPPPPSTISMNGQEVFRFAVESMVKSVREVTARAGLSPNDVHHFVCHQANRRIIESAAGRLGAPLERFFINIESRGNTSAASVPLALDELRASGGLHRGERVVLAGFGGGLTYGAIYMIW
ncbi:MAG: beta-ketoacyl-ACP synthase 3 [Oscillospiraceae bacterium]|jgi:3-oxoacyl-[acyl-carrier-protein] synthase-3|nr:beta-ketoacyl-ACP synthase 3 [Oscillospiraceae bacterium]